MARKGHKIQNQAADQSEVDAAAACRGQEATVVMKSRGRCRRRSGGMAMRGEMRRAAALRGGGAMLGGMMPSLRSCQSAPFGVMRDIADRYSCEGLGAGGPGGSRDAGRGRRHSKSKHPGRGGLG
jgi:hypothetical protein